MSQKNTYYKYREPVLSFDKASINQGLIPHGRYCGFDSGAFAIDGSTFTLTLSHSTNSAYWVDKASAATTRVGLIVSPQGQIFQTDQTQEIESIPGNNATFDYFYTIIMTLQYEEVEGGNNYPTFRISSNSNSASPISAPTDLEKYETVIGYVWVRSNATINNDPDYVKWIPAAPASLGGNYNKFNNVLLRKEQGYTPGRGLANYFDGILNSQSTIEVTPISGTATDTDISNRPVLEFSGDEFSNIVNIIDTFDTGNDEITDIFFDSVKSFANQSNDESIKLTLVNSTGNVIKLGYADFSTTTGAVSKKSIITKDGNLGFELQPNQSCTLNRILTRFEDDSTGIYWIIEEDVINKRSSDNEDDIVANYAEMIAWDESRILNTIGTTYTLDATKTVTGASGEGVVIAVQGTATYYELSTLTLGGSVDWGERLILYIAGSQDITLIDKSNGGYFKTPTGENMIAKPGTFLELHWGQNPTWQWNIISSSKPLLPSYIDIPDYGTGETYDFNQYYSQPTSGAKVRFGKRDGDLLIDGIIYVDSDNVTLANIFNLPTNYVPSRLTVRTCHYFYSGLTEYSQIEITVNSGGNVSIGLTPTVPSSFQNHGTIQLYLNIRIPLE